MDPLKDLLSQKLAGEVLVSQPAAEGRLQLTRLEGLYSRWIFQLHKRLAPVHLLKDFADVS